MLLKNKKLFDFFIILFIVVIITIIYFISENMKDEKIKLAKEEKYNIYASNIYNEVDLVLKSKQENTFSIVLALAQDRRIINALKQNNSHGIDLKQFSKTLKNTTHLQNAWFHIIDAKGNSFYRSWVSKRGDSLLNIRIDIARMIQKPQIMNTISTGKFDMTFKSMVPIYDNEKFIGIFEIITHFNSIANQLKKEGLEMVAIVDTKYKKQLTKAFTKIFIEDYYIANHNAKKELLDYLQKKKIKNFIHTDKKYIIDEENGYFIVVYNIVDIQKQPMASLVIFKDLDSLSIESIQNIRDNMTQYIIIVTLMLLLIGYYFISKKHSYELDTKVKKRTQELLKEKQYIQTILDTNPNIIIVTNSFKIIDANKRFLEFFQYDSISNFMEDYDCICDFFLTLDDEPFCKDKMVKGIPWARYIAQNKIEHIVQLKYKERIYIFTVSAEYLKNNGDILLTFQNITEIKRKDRLLFEQSKLASMGEMIGNIAHQWRQPLSIVSSSATGMKLQKEFNKLSDEEFNQYCDLINENAQYLSKTIDDFRNFIKGDSEKTYFLLSEEFQKMLNLITPSVKSNNIEFILDIKDDIKLYGFSSELLQSLLNIYNNAKDSLVEVPEEERLFIVKAKQNNKRVETSVQDSGKGISEDIAGKVFEPYFTTKHQKQGTGLGLHMTYNMIVHGMNGTIEAKNSTFRYKNKEYFGALFIISFPL